MKVSIDEVADAFHLQLECIVIVNGIGLKP